MHIAPTSQSFYSGGGPPPSYGSGPVAPRFPSHGAAPGHYGMGPPRHPYTGMGPPPSGLGAPAHMGGGSSHHHAPATTMHMSMQPIAVPPFTDEESRKDFYKKQGI